MTSLIPAPSAFLARKTPFNERKRTGEHDPADDAIQIMATESRHLICRNTPCVPV